MKPLDGKELEQLGMQLRDRSKYPLAISRLFANFTDSQKKSKVTTKALVHKVSDFILYYALSEVVFLL